MIVSFTFYKPMKAKAAVTGTLIVGGIVVAAAAAALGIGVAAAVSNESYGQKCQDIWDHIDSNVKKNINAMQTAGSVVTGFLSSEFLHAVVDGFRSHYQDSGAVSMINDPQQLCKLFDWNIENYGTNSRYGVGLALMRGALKNVTLLAEYTASSGMSISLPYCQVAFGNIQTGYNVPNFYNISATVANGWNIDTLGQFNVKDALNYSSKYAVIQATYGTNQYCYYLFNDSISGNGICVYPNSDVVVTPSTPDVYNPANENFFAQGVSVLNNKVDDVISRVASAEGVLNGIQVYLPPIVGTLTNINDQIKSLTQSQVTQKDVTTTDDKTKNDDTNKNRNSNPPKNPDMPDLTLPTGIQKKFPFCLPWDLAALYKLFQVSPKAPRWDVPINIDQGMIHVHQTYKFDMNSNGVMDNFLPVFKWFLNLTVVAGLIFLFKKIVS